MDFFLPFNEKRKFPRIKVNSPITLEEQESGKTYEAHCLDLSATGSRVILDEPLTVNTLLRIKLSSPLGLDPFCALARVVYNSLESGHEIGLEITEILD
ncbi:PilZ domain-containing protein [Oceanospirillum beijerinckii]|uniref:PilZ domain-containing protein n=1 Tax=Oceanospirillum beijerinckii TaxID=64976 RepID=UPI00041CF508|nr:PilZ domain-containing protein [Oceanospirillum beijerinckii]